MKKLIGLLVFLAPLLAYAQVNSPQENISISGKVTDQKLKVPLEGATVHIKGTTHEVVTDEHGEFRFVTGQHFPVTLEISFSGYQAREVEVTSSQPVTVRLTGAVTQLGDVVISSGYATQTKKNYTGAAAQVTAAQLANKPAQSFDQLLGGQAPGVDIIAPSNSLNNTPVFRIRGLNSITSGVYPLIVIDGVTVWTGSVGGALGNNPLADLNPADIATIDILKDASATAIYGSRAANGVVVITTKRGKKGRSTANYDAWVSFSSPYRLPKLLDAEQYVTIKNEAMTNAGLTPGFALQKLPDSSVVNTNWYDVAYHTGVAQNHNLSLSGANDATSYFLSVGYTNQDGFIRNSNFTHKVIRLNVEHQLIDHVTVGTDFSYSNSLNTGPNSGAIPSSSTSAPTSNTQYIGTEPVARLTYILPPNVAALNQNGTYNIQNATSVGYGANVPSLVGTINAYNLALLIAQDKNSSENNSIVGNVYAEWSIIKGLKLKTSYGLDNLVVENKQYENPVNGDGALSNGLAANTNTKYDRSDWANTLTYAATLGAKQHLKALAGYEQVYQTINGWGAEETNVTDPYYTTYQGGWATIVPYGNVQSANGLVSYFANANYDYGNRYLLSFNFRRDGLSALSQGHQYGNFAGGSLGWNISEESFYKGSSFSRIVNDLKIRGSYGQVGNSSIGSYPALGLYSSATYTGQATLAFSQAGNANLKWETSKKTDIGLNFALFNNLVTVDADYYKNEINGLILAAQQASSLGIPGNSINENIGSMYNKGIELGISAHILQGKQFTWDASFNFSTLQNKVTALAGGDIYTASSFGIQNMTRVGYSLGSIWAVPTAGVNPANGQRLFINAAGKEVQYSQVGTPSKWTYTDGTTAAAIDNYLDGKVQGPSLPKYFGGFNNTFGYKNFDLGIGITFSGGNLIYNGTRATISDQRYFNNGTFILDRWTHAGQVTNIPKLEYGDNVSTGFTITNTSCVENGSYAKLKNLSLGYRLPASALTHGRLSSARVYVDASNVFTITRYTGSDPEVSINGNSIASGKDQNVPPNARVITVGVNIGF